MTGILQGNAALAFGVLALVFVIASTIPMRRLTLSVLSAAGLFAVFVVFHVNHKLSSDEGVSVSESGWYTNSGIFACLVMMVACLIAHILHRWQPGCPHNKDREALRQSHATVRVHR